MNKNINPVTLVLVLVFLYPLLKGFLFKFSSSNLKAGIDEINRNISFIISLVLGIYYGKKIFLQHEAGVYKQIYKIIPDSVVQYIESNSFIVYAVVIPILIFIVYRIIKLIFDLISYVTLYPVLDGLEKFLSSKSSFFKRIAGMLAQFPKAVCYVLIVTFVLNIMSIFGASEKLNEHLEASKPYNTICKEIVIPITDSQIAKKLPGIINNSFRIVIKEPESKETTPGKSVSKGRTIVYYNGVTLDQGVKSDAEIDKTAREITAKESDTKGKAKIIYNWIGSNISYDHDKANKVLNNNFNVESGAIPTFNTGKGICFDYSCLYVAMARANHIKVRLITGEGFNGVSWVSHAWNQVYIPEEGKWINVDTTFYKGGNYFNSKRFDLDHRGSQIAGEW
ncbi:transglutaminase-like domain-containing protein [Clostridium sp. OS1-26]|uniref:transglutaminase-like domain-containing protein n=1 Tax=Clostridium sp. OS1-26 TaxID=3070681 RepID=UPI0027E12253|nr:transglutaminase-like domain-containing protein [Clostridium sp. OS1-26]WML35922.1 transglutaminase-like domain-containing protein [Clostridium sp. OS1-26]